MWVRRIRAWVILLVSAVAVGLLLGIGGGVIGGYVGRRSTTNWGDLIGAVVGAYLGYMLGVAIGVAGIGRRLLPRGSPLLAVLGSGLGGVLAIALAEPMQIDQSRGLFRASLILFPATLATLGYSLQQGGAPAREPPRADGED